MLGFQKSAVSHFVLFPSRSGLDIGLLSFLYLGTGTHKMISFLLEAPEELDAILSQLTANLF